MGVQLPCRMTRVVQTHLVLLGDCNMHNTLFGGRLMELIDNTASIAFSRFSRSLGVTASMDTLNFIKPLPLAHSVCVEAMVSGAGTSSVEVFVKVVGEDVKTGMRYLAATAFLTFVTLPDEETGERVTLPTIKPETAEEKFVCGGYKARRQDRLSQRTYGEQFNKQIDISNPWVNR